MIATNWNKSWDNDSNLGGQPHLPSSSSTELSYYSHVGGILLCSFRFLTHIYNSPPFSAHNPSSSSASPTTTLLQYDGCSELNGRGRDGRSHQRWSVRAQKDQGNERAAEVLGTLLQRYWYTTTRSPGRLTISTEGKLIVDCTGEGPSLWRPKPTVIWRTSATSASRIRLPRKLLYSVPRRQEHTGDTSCGRSGDQVQMRRVRPWPGDQPLHVRRDCRHGVRQLVGRDGPRPAAIDPTFPRPVPPPLPLASRY
ncbi:hypothetical protein HPP92_024135 [Vanilla planifolia]|uniref:Uncharacterized protein n=1 Tax=Vanilla planifolia TaxID=51239 RepID=A0A835PKT5_VANPL|nr:hypothetical protein HPP92_024411 [Vanilla planifolia]KAG0456347.1 hypothetical protein HPP92_024135 [Vanilla planifolia]